MTNDDHLFVLLRGSVAWNQWRQRNPKIRADLHNVDLSKATLSEADFDLRNLSRADLSGVNRLHSASPMAFVKSIPPKTVSTRPAWPRFARLSFAA